MSRSKWKGPFLEKLFYKTIVCLKRRKTAARGSIITENMVGRSVFVHNGQVYRKCTFTRERVGYKLGCFSFTRRLIPGVSEKKKV